MARLAFGAAWVKVERALFDYLLAQSGTEEGVTAFPSWSWPAEMVRPGDDFWMWSVQLSGGETVVPNTFGQLAGGAHHVAGEIVVRAGSEDAGMRAAGLLMEAIHGVGPQQITPIQKAYASGYPQKSRALRNVMGNEGTPVPGIVSEVVIPIRVAFGSVEE